MILNNYPWQVLIIDDEQRDWVVPMTELLQDAAKNAKLSGLKITSAIDQQTAERLLARQNFHLISLDMRLPERSGEAISVDTGEKLARQFPYVGFPKCLIYTQTLREGDIQQATSDAVRVLRIPMDQYAKPTGSDRVREDAPVEVLTVKEWARRVVDSFSHDQSKLVLNPAPLKGAQMPLTVIGAYFEYGPRSLPPLLAQHLQDLASHWETKDATRRVDTADRFIEVTTRLALAQTAVLMRHEGKQPGLPNDEKRISCIHQLKEWYSEITGWNFSNYLTEDAIQALDKARQVRNKEDHTQAMADPKRAWAMLREPLQYALDIAAYWVRHPLCINLRYSRDGWNAECLAGIAYPRLRYPLPASVDFPTEAIHGGVWQSVWTNDERPQHKAVCWNSWLVDDDHSERPWWLTVANNQRGQQVWLDLDSGKERMT